MANRIEICPACGAWISTSATVCHTCGTAFRRPWWRGWPVLAAAALLAAAAILLAVARLEPEEQPEPTPPPAAGEETIRYQAVTVKTLLDELRSDADRAEAAYLEQNVEVTGHLVAMDGEIGETYLLPGPAVRDAAVMRNQICVRFTPSDQQLLDQLKAAGPGAAITVRGKILAVSIARGYFMTVKEIETE